MKIKNKLKIFIRYIIPLVLVAWMIVINPWQDFAKRLTTVDILPLLLALGINFGLIFSLKAYRWRMAIQNPPPFWVIYASQLEGQLANILIGMGVADFVRSSRLRKDQKDTFPEDLGTAIADRICEYMALSLMLAASTLTPWVPLFWLAAPVIFIGAILMMLYRPQKLIDRFHRWPKVCRAISTVNSALAVKRRMFFMIGASFLSWLCEILMLLIVLHVLGLPSHFGLAAMILVAINVAIAIPGPPANLGTFEAGSVLALTAVGIQSEAAISFALFYHGFHVISTSIVASIVWLWRNYRQSPPLPAKL